MSEEKYKQLGLDLVEICRKHGINYFTGNFSKSLHSHEQVRFVYTGSDVSYKPNTLEVEYNNKYSVNLTEAIKEIPDGGH